MDGVEHPGARAQADDRGTAALGGDVRSEAGGAERADVPRPDSRGIHRIPIRLVVSRRGLSAPLGVTRDLSLRGVFIETAAPLPIGTIVPLALELAPGEPPLELEAEVMRVTELGMGLAFVGQGSGTTRAQRRLRRWIVDRTSVQGTQRQVEQLHDDARNVEPIRGATRIAAVLAQIIEARAPVLLIPIDRLVRDDTRLVATTDGELRLTTRDASLLAPGDEVFALAQLGYVAYSFALRVLRVEPWHKGSAIIAEPPTAIVYSERRARDRAPATPGTLVCWPTPWDPERRIAYPVLEHNAHGLSFRAAESGCLLAPGAPLPGALLVGQASAPSEERALPGAEVRHITRVVEPDGATWLRVGVSFGASHRPVVEIATSASSRGVLGWLRRVASKARTIFSYGLHKSRARLAGGANDVERVTIHGGPHPLVGVLDRTRVDERLRCPLVIVVPGFVGRKEQMSFFAGTVVEGFAKNHRDIAVLRFDGSNNIGESGKDPGCEADGMHCLHYTLSGLVADVDAVLAWARKNPFVDPTHIVLVTASMAAIGVRHALTRNETADVGLWVSYMGAPDAVDVIRLVSGNIDLHAYWRRGQKLGVVSLNGMLTDGDRFWADLQRLDIGDVAAAQREMGLVRADVVWLYGRHDAFMDPRHVHQIMSVAPPPGSRRELIEVDGGHLPRTSDEAVSQFVRLTRRIWQHVHQAQMEPFTPSVGRLAAKAAGEWEAVRRARPSDRGAWWRRYLLDPEGLGFDVLEHADAYRTLMDRQADLLVASPVQAGPALPILDLGAGTGNLLVRLVARGHDRVVATDLVAEALDAAIDKLPDESRARVERRVHDGDGSPLTAMRRFLAGDLASPRELAERVPGLHRSAFEHLLATGADGVHAAMRGHEIDLRQLARELRLSELEVELLSDLGRLARLARVARGQPHAPSADDAAGLVRVPASALVGPAGLPYPDASFRAVGMSLFLSYLEHPEDALYEAHRVLAPGGRLVVSSLVPDYDSSKLYVDLIKRFEAMSDDALPPGITRQALLDSARRFVDHAAELLRFAEEGLFRFWDAPALLDLVRRRGFVDATAEPSFGDPPQAVIVTCHKP